MWVCVQRYRIVHVFFFVVVNVDVFLSALCVVIQHFCFIHYLKTSN